MSALLRLMLLRMLLGFARKSLITLMLPLLPLKTPCARARSQRSRALAFHPRIPFFSHTFFPSHTEFLGVTGVTWVETKTYNTLGVIWRGNRGNRTLPQEGSAP